MGKLTDKDILAVFEQLGEASSPDTVFVTPKVKKAIEDHNAAYQKWYRSLRWYQKLIWNYQLWRTKV